MNEKLIKMRQALEIFEEITIHRRILENVRKRHAKEVANQLRCFESEQREIAQCLDDIYRLLDALAYSMLKTRKSD